MWKLYKLHFRYSKEDVWKAFSLTIRKRAFHCHLRHWEAYTVSFLSNQFYPCSSKDSKIHLHSLLENLMDVFPPPPSISPSYSRSIRRMGPSALQTLSHLVCKVVFIRVDLKHVWKLGERVAERTLELKTVVLLTVFGMILVYLENAQGMPHVDTHCCVYSNF